MSGMHWVMITKKMTVPWNELYESLEHEMVVSRLRRRWWRGVRIVRVWWWRWCRCYSFVLYFCSPEVPLAIDLNAAV